MMTDVDVGFGEGEACSAMSKGELRGGVESWKAFRCGWGEAGGVCRGDC